MIDSKKKKVGVTLPGTLHLAVKSEAALRGLNVEGAYQQALENWLNQGKTTKSAKPMLRNAQWHALLDVILDYGSQEDITGIQANLRWGGEAVEKLKPPAKSRAAG